MKKISCYLYGLISGMMMEYLMRIEFRFDALIILILSTVAVTIILFKDNDIISIIKKSWDNNIYSSANETILGLESKVEGKEDFINEIKKI